MITFPRSKVKQFYAENPNWFKKGGFFGKKFSAFMQLEDVENPEDRKFCHTLANADSLSAIRMVQSRTDWTK